MDDDRWVIDEKFQMNIDSESDSDVSLSWLTWFHIALILGTRRDDDIRYVGVRMILI